MATTDLFDFAAERLEQHASLDRLTARGTLRIALKLAGLVPKELTVEQLRVVLERLLPAELEKCGVSGARGICSGLAMILANLPASTQPAKLTDADEIFRRLGES